MKNLRKKTFISTIIILVTVALLISVFTLNSSIFNRNSKASISSVGYSASNGIVYHNGNPITLHGVNWFGFENPDTHLVHGLWLRSYKDMIQQMKKVGINALRIPYCPATLQNVPIATNSYIDLTKNPDFTGTNGAKYINSLDALDKVLIELNNNQMYFILDNHNPDCQAQSDLWYTSNYSETQWINNLNFLADRYRSQDYFLGLDLKNEPRNTATWGTGNLATDWNLAAERAGSSILKINPNLAIIVEGVGENPICSNSGFGHFWGENLESFACSPISTDQIPQNKLLLSPHIYGPDVYNQSYFQDSNFPSNMANIWDKQFGYLVSKGYTLVPGEWGGKYGNGGLPSDVTWHNALTDYYKSRGICSSFYWSWNADSGDTGGILKDDWSTLWTDKVTMLNSYWNSCQVSGIVSSSTPNITTTTIAPTSTTIAPTSTTVAPTSTTVLITSSTIYNSTYPITTVPTTTPIGSTTNSSSIIPITSSSGSNSSSVSQSPSNSSSNPSTAKTNSTVTVGINTTINNKYPIINGVDINAYKVEVQSTLQTYFVTPDNSGNWSLTVTSPLENGLHSIKVYDKNNNLLENSNFIVNTVLPNTGILDNVIFLSAISLVCISISVIMLNRKKSYIRN